MASGMSLQHIFENPLPEKPTLLQSLSVNQIRPVKPIDDSSFTELFGELHFKESPQLSPSSSLLPTSPSLDLGSDINQTSVSSTPEGHDFENPLLESPSLLESLSFNKIKPARPVDESSISEIFDELHFSESPTPSPPSSAPVSALPSTGLQMLDQKDVFDSRQSTPESNYIIRHKRSDSFSSLNSDSLHFCTEGLGFESSDDMEDLKAGMDEYCWETQSEKSGIKKKNLASEDSYGECRRSKIRGLEYPPPISCIGSTGKPWVWFKSYRDNGRFVLKEIRIPTREYLNAYREDGRLKLHFVLPDGEFLEEQNEEEEDDDAESRDGEEDDDDGVVSIDEGEENTEKGNYDGTRDQGNEGKEIDV
ncbi:protein FANTASTIC FOUR 3-like [Prosopis cineraria]|uniref:protein FANTASTIC FOUR 3-like n=1 Tax=Prosopis cineraria TaxID=364024 RepID=UPI00240F21AA|nr:protein FANTASTIC FOUR 3-like [Prosopis cineraria]